MHPRRLSTSSLLVLSLYLAACGSSDGDSGAGAGSTAGGSGPAGGSSAGGAAGASAGASGQGGKSGSPGQGGSSVGGAAGSSAGGAAGAAAGGSAGSSVGGTAGSAAGGSAGSATGGSAGGPGGKGGQGGSSAGGAAGAAAGGSSGQGGSAVGGAGGTTAAALTQVQIDPPGATLTVTNGVVTTQTFQVLGTYDDGSVKPLAASWEFDRLDLAQVTPGSGVMTPSGDKGGKGTLTAVSEGSSLSVEVSVKLVFTDNPGNLTPEQQGQLEVPGGTDGGGKLVYPYDGTVFARGLLTPELMWSGGAAGDGYLVRVIENNFEASYYVQVNPPARTLLPQAVWDALTVTNQGEAVQVEVRRLSGGSVFAPMKQSWKIAQGSLRGTINYWAVNTGQIMKINPGAAQPVLAFDSGAAAELGNPAPASYNGNSPPWTSGGDGKRCITCHVVSKDGSRFVGAMQWDAPGNYGRPWASVDLTTNTFTQVSGYTDREIFFALSPEGKYVVRNPESMTLRLGDAATGAGQSSLLDGFTDKVADPSFSPDGLRLAFSSNVTGGYPVEFTRADLDVVDFDPVSATFSNRRQLVAGGQDAIAFPSFAPDSQTIIYQKGDYSRAKYDKIVDGALVSTHGVDDLYLTSLTPGFGEITLDRANGVGHVEDRNRHLNYQPTVNPIAVGGYYWVVFVSPRDYGNKMLSSTDPTYENRKQLWVAAIDANPQPGQDPSHPAFLLRGQDETTTNMSGYWSLEACKQQGNSCNEGFECCTGFCRDDGAGNAVCVPPPANSCSTVGEKCGADGDCCPNADSALVCLGGFCSLAKP